jgi:hypothetical protein
MLAPVTHILPLTGLRRARTLPGVGQVLVRTGQKVNAVDVIAEQPSKKEHLLLNVTDALNIDRSEFSKSLISRSVGDVLQEGDIIAELGGLFKRVLRAPAAGEILLIAGSMILYEVDLPPIQLQAGYTGQVAEIIPDRGAFIEGSGALVQGVWGNGKIDLSLLNVVANSLEDDFSPQRLDVTMRGSVVLGGHCSNLEALKNASELPLRGLILGSMTADLIPEASKLSFPVVLLEGFGKIPINKTAYDILLTNNKREVCLNAAPWDHFSGGRPEVFIPLPATGELPPETDEFRTGQKVRILSTPYSGHVGILEDLQPEQVLLPNGLRSRAGLVRLKSQEKVVIPLVNMEVLA